MQQVVQIAERFATEFLGKGDLADADALTAENVTVHTGLRLAEPIRGCAAVRSRQSGYSPAGRASPGTVRGASPGTSPRSPRRGVRNQPSPRAVTRDTSSITV